MVDIPAEEDIKSIIKAGKVFYFPEPSFLSSEPHYYVVLNYDPVQDTMLLLVNATSNLEGRKRARRNLHKDTLVFVTPNECSFFSMDSVFDCNSPHVFSLERLVNRREAGDFKVIGDIPDDTLDNLRRGVLISPLVEDETKDILREASI